MISRPTNISCGKKICIETSPTSGYCLIPTYTKRKSILGNIWAVESLIPFAKNDSKSGIHKLWNPAILEWRTWNKFEKHQKHEKMENANQMTSRFKALFLWSKALVLWLKQSICQPYDSKHFKAFIKTSYSIYNNGWKNYNIRAWRTWSWVISRLENVKRLLETCSK